jgi:glyoxylase-like metal-dependent hydrolase (beta-lactamase superfamily II)
VSAPAEVAPGLWRWTARHPDWHPGAFGAEVACFAVVAGDELLLLDPLLPGDDEATLARLDALAGAAARTAILITIPYHARSAHALSDRYAARVHGPPATAKRLPAGTRAFLVFEPGAEGPGRARAFAIGSPRRSERPLWLPSHEALAFGDALVTTPEGDLRAWLQQPLDDARRRWYRERFAPTLSALRELPARRILTTHGAPVLTGGARALAAALDGAPWYHHG